MTELIPITNQAGQSLVPARALHQYLQNGKKFTDWFKHRARKYGLEEGRDYVSLSPGSEKGRPSIEYGLTLDTAKQLSMVEANDRGKQARLYFIEKEQQALAMGPALLQFMQETQQRIQQLEQRVTMALPESEQYTILGFARLQGRSVDMETAIKLGKRAVHLSTVQGFKIGKVPDVRHGVVNAYQKEILEAVFSEQWPIL